jgi:2-polyprenyl-6-methoxyphenol hydroxylase-like FAD-dependent oxidoreductase
MTSVEHRNREPRHLAVVCGASMAGLLAARVLSKFYDAVVVVERDVLPEDASQRRGVAQGRHLHQLLTRGARIFAEHFPGVLDDLRAAGAPVIDGSDPSMFYFRAGGHDLDLTGSFTRPDEMLFPFASRPLLEDHVRRRVQAIDNVTFRDGHDVVEPVLNGSGRVDGVRIVDRSSSAAHTLAADLVVDATGRSARMSALLERWGYPRPPEHKYSLDLCYSSQFLQLPADLLTTKLAVSAQPLQRLGGAAVLAYEHDTMVLTIMGLAGYQAPTDLPGLLDDAAQLLPPAMITALRAAEPLGGVATQRYPASVWRRYDKLRRFPDGLIVIGDAVCSFNPIWGQGMTSAALQAVALRESLSRGESDWQRTYFASAARKLRSIWWGNRALDFILTPAEGWRATPKRLVNSVVDKVWAAAANDIGLTETFLRTIELLDTQAVWLKPTQVKRILTAYRNKVHAAHHEPHPPPPPTPRPAMHTECKERN